MMLETDLDAGGSRSEPPTRSILPAFVFPSTNARKLEVTPRSFTHEKSPRPNPHKSERSPETRCRAPKSWSWVLADLAQRSYSYAKPGPQRLPEAAHGVSHALPRTIAVPPTWQDTTSTYICQEGQVLLALTVSRIAECLRTRSPHPGPHHYVISLDLDAWFKSALFSTQAATVQGLADSALPTLIVGEPGLPLTDVADYLHRRSRRPGTLDRLNCMTVSARAFETRVIKNLAPSRRRGATHQGTLCLEHIDLLPPALRTRLSHALSTTDNTGKRLLATSHRPADELRADAGFQDLYWSLALTTATLLPIRERISDLPTLVGHILSELKREAPYELTFDTAAQEKLSAHRWPGNLAELRNVVRRALECALAAHDNPNLPPVAPEHIVFDGDESRRKCLRTTRKRGRPSIDIAAAQLEDALIAYQTGRSTRDIAPSLGVSHATAWRRLRDLQKRSTHK